MPAPPCLWLYAAFALGGEEKQRQRSRGNAQQRNGAMIPGFWDFDLIDKLDDALMRLTVFFVSYGGGQLPVLRRNADADAINGLVIPDVRLLFINFFNGVEVGAGFAETAVSQGDLPCGIVAHRFQHAPIPAAKAESKLSLFERAVDE